MRGDAAGARDPMTTQQIRKIQKDRIAARSEIAVNVNLYLPVLCWLPASYRKHTSARTGLAAS